MHELRSVTRAVDAWLLGAPLLDARARVRLLIVDPVRAEACAVRELARLVLDERGLAGVGVEVDVRPRPCATCGHPGTPTPIDPTCPACGLPFAPGDGPAIEPDLAPQHREPAACVS
jgi:hypothetical protein